MVRAQVTILLVEYRDEVFARIAADLAATGVVVQRAGNGAEASRVHARRGVNLLLVNADLPDGSGWLLSSKLRMVDPEVSIWIYTPRATPDDGVHGQFHRRRRIDRVRRRPLAPQRRDRLSAGDSPRGDGCVAAWRGRRVSAPGGGLTGIGATPAVDLSRGPFGTFD